MKVVITGASGTVGSALTKFLQGENAEVIPWDRSKASINDYFEMEGLLKTVRPEVAFHLAVASQSTGIPNESWQVNYEWPSELAWICRLENIKFFYISTAMVFSDNAEGPFTLSSQPDAAEGYGREKRLAEERMGYQNPNAYVVRLGWQIGDSPGSNNMIDYFENQMKEKGRVYASRKWLPACSFLEDTAKALYEICEYPAGLYMADSNEKWNFYEIASALNKLHGERWKIEPTDDFVYDQRLIDKRVSIPSLKQRLKWLP